MFLGGIMVNIYADNLIEIEGIIFSLPECVSIEEKTPVEDFTLIDFYLNNDTVILKGYMGNFPQKIYRDKIDFILNELIISEYKGKHWFKRDTFNDISSGEIILEVNKIEWPNYIQFWYNNVNDELLDIIEKIILSVRGNAKVPGTK
jgi:hypothetical protein